MNLQLKNTNITKFLILNLLVFLLVSCQGQQNGSSENTQSDSENDEVFVDSHTSRNALDWSGTYTGVLPCEDCEGIETMIRLNDDQTYIIKTKNPGESNQIVESGGTFTWNESGTNITLDETPQKLGSGQFKVGENMLMLLDQEGNTISNDQSSSNELEKAIPSLTNQYWKLHSVYGNIVAWDQDHDKHPHLIFEKEDDKVMGHNGCNSVSGSFEVNGNKIKLNQLVTTKMSCPETDLETQFMKALEETESYFIKDDIMALSNGEEQEIARFEVVYIRN